MAFWYCILWSNWIKHFRKKKRDLYSSPMIFTITSLPPPPGTRHICSHWWNKRKSLYWKDLNLKSRLWKVAFKLHLQGFVPPTLINIESPTLRIWWKGEEVHKRPHTNLNRRLTKTSFLLFTLHSPTNQMVSEQGSHLLSQHWRAGQNAKNLCCSCSLVVSVSDFQTLRLLVWDIHPAPAPTLN